MCWFWSATSVAMAFVISVGMPVGMVTLTLAPALAPALAHGKTWALDVTVTVGTV